MDVYVLLEDGKVLGAAGTLDVASEIADRRGDHWDSWAHSDRVGSWTRTRPNGTYRSFQLIVCVPLAGVRTSVMRSEIEEIGRSFGAP